MLKKESMEKLMDIRRRCGEIQFRMAMQLLFEAGKENFTKENVSSSKGKIKKKTPKNAIMTEGYQTALLDCARELSAFPTWDIFLYVKLYMTMQGDDLVQLEEAEQDLKAWNSLSVPQKWKDALADSHIRGDILHEMVRRRQPKEYTEREIEDVIRFVLEE